MRRHREHAKPEAPAPGAGPRSDRDKVVDDGGLIARSRKGELNPDAIPPGAVVQ